MRPKEFVKYIVLFTFVILSFESITAGSEGFYDYLPALDSPGVELIYPLQESYDPSVQEYNVVDFQTPLNISNNVQYDPVSGRYVFSSNIGDSLKFRPPSSMTMEEYLQYKNQKSIEDFWVDQVNEQISVNRDEESNEPEINVDKGPRKMFGSDFVEIRPQGSAELSFGVNISRTDNPILPEKQRRISTFDFDQKIQMNLTGKIGDLMKIGFNYNTEATFDFENELKLNYGGEEDDIIQKIEAGNVSMPLNSSLINGSQSLFGLKTELKFGRVTATTVLSQQRGQKKEIEIAGGAQINDFEIFVDNYEENRHFFLNYYFRDVYDSANKTLPLVTSNVQIQRIEVWVTNRTNDFDETRNVIGFTDLGEGRLEHFENPSWYMSNNNLPSNSANNLINALNANSGTRNYVNAANILSGAPFNMKQAVEFEKLANARLLNSNEYTYNSLLGYISLNQSLNNDEVLCVAYQYTYQGQTYQVGEFSTDGVSGQDALFLKLLKSTVRSPRNKLWDLMMKNVYSLGAYQIDPANFRLNVWYNNPSTGVDINFIPKSNVDQKILIQLLGMDRLNQQQAAYSDGLFDFLPVTESNGKISGGGTINPRNGRLYFTTLEPFGTTLDKALEQNGVSAAVRKTVVFQQLYDSTKTAAQQLPELNRYRIKGSYQSSVSSEISLSAMNIPQGSVKVTAGGRQLNEGSDYTVDYNLGRVKILNDGILSAGTPIKISLESNSLFSIQTKSLIGTHLDYKVSRDANIGATILRLTERPLTPKINIGDEPIANTVFGLDGSIRKEVPFLTKMVDKIPFIDTKEKSMVNFSGEIAAIIPGHNDVIGEEGNSYIDDFEGSQSAIDLKTFNSWSLASVPSGDQTLNGNSYNDLSYGYKRAKLAWYVIDPIFHNNQNITPANIKNNDEILQDHRQRQIMSREVFPNKQLASGAISNLLMMDMSYYPSERGPYNFQPLNSQGNLPNSEDNWGGIMRMLTTNDFEAANIEFIQFWVMNPFNENSSEPGDNEFSDNNTGGQLYFNLGNISEDVLKDGRKAFENGMPTDGVYDNQKLVTTSWGWMPTSQVIVNAFDNDVTTRIHQDVGLDGLNDANERIHFQNALTNMLGAVGDQAIKSQIMRDPAADNYMYYRDDELDARSANILERYKNYNNPQGNSPTSEMSDTINADGYLTSASTLPNIEDLNQDNNLNETESYFEYKINLKPGSMNVGENYIVDRMVGKDEKSNKSVYWYQFRIPLREFTGRVNQIQDFRSIRFIRMYLKGWTQPVVLRFASLELIRGEWRSYLGSLLAEGEYLQTEESNTTFNIGAVNVEANGSRDPINYVLPEGIVREISFQTANMAQLNEQSLVLDVCGLKDGDARAAYRNVNFDVRNYKKIKMFVHGEANELDAQTLKDNDVTVFVRLGTDFVNNYYEYEMPVKLTPWYSTTSDAIWPVSNEMVIDLQALKNVKINRNALSGNHILDRYTEVDPNDNSRNITIIGNPNLQNLKTIMIGVRNPKFDDPSNKFQPDDGLDKCVEIWVNELRLTDFDESGGWATIGRLSANLADFADVSLAGNYATPGWGSIEKRVSERSREYVKGMDVSSTVQLGKFFGNNTGVRLPMYVGYSMNEITPMYDPLNPDLLFKPEVGMDKDEWRETRRNGSNVTIRKSINFTNVRIDKQTNKPKPVKPQEPKLDADGNPKKEKVKKKGPHFYDVSNFSVSYAFSEIYRHDVNINFDRTENHLAGVNYGFNNTPKAWEPFKNMLRKSKYFRPIRDFNLYLAPKQIGLQTTMNRTYNEYAVRYNFSPAPDPIVQYNKQFNWDRNYDFKYDISKSLKFDFNAKNRSFIEEAPGKVDYGVFGYESQGSMDSVKTSMRNFGRTMNYGHSADVSYKWPFNKIPFTEWFSLTTNYTANYDWTMAPLSLTQNGMDVGNVIQNSRKVSWNGKVNMITVYNKVPYFKKVSQSLNGGGQRSSRVSSKSSGKDEDDGSDDGTDKDNKKGKDKEKEKDGFDIFKEATKLLLSIKNITINYSTTDGIMLPGYNKSTNMMGMDGQFKGPSTMFIAGGYQQFDIFGRPNDLEFWDVARDNNWLVGQDGVNFINSQYTSNHQEALNLKASLQPFNGMRIDLSGTRNITENLGSNLYWDTLAMMPTLANPQITGSFSSSIVTWKTSFSDKVGDDVLSSKAFNQLRENRIFVSQILGSTNTNSDLLAGTGGYAGGYDSSQQEVVIGAFLTAYTGKDVSAKNINPFRQLPLPNWRITYDGLSKKKWLQKWVRTLSFTHAYRSTYNVSNYNTNLNYQENEAGPVATNLAGNIISKRQILTVSIMEQFAPLLGVDLTLTNNFMGKIEFKKDRNLSLGLTNNQILEIKGTELVVGSGYKFKNVDLSKWFKNVKIPASDLNLRLDVSIRDNKTITRKIVENTNQATAGQKMISIKFSGDYKLGKNLSLRAYFDRVVNKPLISMSFPTANTNAGIALRFQLQ